MEYEEKSRIIFKKQDRYELIRIVVFYKYNVQIKVNMVKSPIKNNNMELDSKVMQPFNS